MTGFLRRPQSNPPTVRSLLFTPCSATPSGSDKERLLRRAEKLRIPISDWFCSPLHPIETGLARWWFHAGHFPVAEGLARTVVNLPTDTLDPDKVLSFLNHHLPLIEPN